MCTMSENPVIFLCFLLKFLFGLKEEYNNDGKWYYEMFKRPMPYAGFHACARRVTLKNPTMHHGATC